ncbi:MAG: hypothetical protein ACRDRL_07845 [Sciscionella sp.]
MSLPNYTKSFSLSHLYSMHGYSNPSGQVEVEVGWYEGLGTELVTSVPHYYATLIDDVGHYHEHDYEAATRGTSYAYETIDTGYDANTGDYKWHLFAGDLSNPRCGTSCNWYMREPYAQPFVGGEVNSDTSGSQLRVHGTPEQELQTGDGVWHQWTLDYPAQQNDHTYACNDPNFTFSIIQHFQEYKATGNGV